MKDIEILKKIKTSKYIGYRLGDIVLNFPCSRKSYIKNCLCPQKKKFPNSIAIKYTNLYTNKQSLGVKIRNKEYIGESLNILKNLCDEISTVKPGDNCLVATIRLGDMIELNREKRNGKELTKYGGTFYTPGGGLRHILSGNEIVDEAKKKKLDEVILIGSKAIGCGLKSVHYLKNMLTVIKNNNLKCSWFYSESPDEDFCYISNSKNIITGPGGFCLVAEAVANFRFNENKS